MNLSGALSSGFGDGSDQPPSELSQGHVDAEFQPVPVASSLASGEVLRAFFDATLDAIVLLNDAGIILDANAATGTLLGHSPDALIHRTLQEFCEPTWEADPVCTLLHQGGEHRGELGLRRPDGSQRIVEYSIRTQVLPQGHLVILRDVSDRKRDEAERARLEANLRTSEATLRDILNNADASIACLRVFANGDWQYEYCSAGHERVFGITAEALMADKTLILARVHPDDRDTKSWHRAIAAGQNQTVEYRFQHPDGSTRWISVALTSRPDPGAESWLVISVAIDITARKQTELALQDQKERYQLAVQAGHVGVWDWDIVHETVRVDANLKTMLGYRDDEVPNTADGWRRLVHPEDVDRLMAGVNDHLEGKTAEYCAEHRMLHRDGSIHWFMVRAIALRDATGTPYRLVGTRTDITEFKQLEQALSLSEANLKDILNQAIAAITRLRLYPDFTWSIEYRSPGGEVIFGFTPDEFRADETLWRSRVPPEDVAAITANFRENVDRGGSHTFEYRFQHQDGSLRWIRSTYRATPDRAGQGWLVTLVETDLTDRKQMELSLRDSEERFRLMADSAPVMLWMTGSGPHITFVNQQWLSFTGRSLDDELGDRWQDNIHPDDRPSLLHTLEEALRTQQTFSAEYRHRRADGDYRWILATGVPRFSPEGFYAGFTGSCVDISDRKQAEEMMQQAIAWEQEGRHRERFIATMTQNIRQTLDLDQMLHTTVEAVQQYLDVERVVIFRFAPDWSGTIIAEAVSDPALSILHQRIYDPCFAQQMLHPYHQGRIHCINDILTSPLEPCYVNLLTSIQARAVLVIPIMTQQNLWGLLIAHQCSGPRQWHHLNWYLLQQLSLQLAIGIYQAELYTQTQLQAQREQILNQVIQVTRQSLDLDTIFTSVTTELGHLLQISRVELVQYLPDEQCWLNVASYRNDPELPDALGLIIPDENNAFAQRLKQLDVVRIEHYDQEADEVNRAFVEDYPDAWLLVPVQVHSAGTTQPRVWGSLSLNQINRSRSWQEWEVELARAVADQLAIAIQQAELYGEVQQLNDALEYQVQVRTEQLQRALEFESILKRIADNVRDSLDETRILEAVLRELAQGLEVSGCDVTLYDMDQGVAIIRHEYLADTRIQSALGATLPFTQYEEIFSQLFQHITFQFCYLDCNNTRAIEHQFAILACPIVDDQHVLGDLWVMRSSEATFNKAEVRLVQQVANQCAIALRQSRLYQAAQAQVQELERLNQLKDDFLSTVSHELRTPMSNIKMATQMLEVVLFKGEGELIASEDSEDDYRLPGSSFRRISRYFKILQDECQREINLINALLDLSRLEANDAPLILTQIDLGTWLTHVVEPFRERAKQGRQQLELVIDPSLPSFATDLDFLERILTELLNNACKYSPPGERILLSAQYLTEQNHLQLSVCNTGVTISAAEQTRIFERFYRIPNNDPWKHGGTGLGLALVKKLVEQLLGQVRVHSDANQVCFIVELPLLSEEDSTDAPSG